MSDYYVHETSLVGEDVNIGDHTRVWQFCNIMSGVTIGRNCNIGQNVFIETGVKLGDCVKVKNNISLYQGVECEDGVFLGPNCVFTNVINPRSFIEKKDQLRRTIVKKGATVGANATIVCGNSIGRYAMVGAGSVVTKDVADYELVVGNPARNMGYVCKCGERIVEAGEKYICNSCDKQYALEDGILVCEEKDDGIY